MPRILFAYPEVAPLFTNGGIGTFVFEAAHLLARCGRWEVDILTDRSYTSYNNTGAEFREAKRIFEKAGIRLIDLDRGDEFLRGWASPDVTRAERFHRDVSRLHAERRYDIIEFPDWRAPGFFIVRHKRTTRAYSEVKLVVHLHSSTKDVWDWQDGYFIDRNDFYCHYMEEYVKNYSDVVLAPTNFMLRPIYEKQALFPKTIFRNGYPTSPAANVIGKEPKQRYRTDIITVACVSRLELRKGQDVLSRAIRSLSTSSDFGEKVRFVFCGRDSLGLDRDGWMSQSIRRILDGIGNWQIVRPKSRSDLERWLTTEVDICVVPSKVDNYPNVVMEAARAGCYVIASDAGGIPEIYNDYAIGGGIFRAGDSDALALEIREAVRRVRNVPGIRIEIANAFEESRRRQAQQTLAVYDKMVEQPIDPVSPSFFVPKARSKVSVIIPFYNAHRYARDAVQSAFASEYTDFEVILVDDGSDDPKSLQFLSEMESEFPALKIIHKPNGGLGDARNAGLKVASGDLIVPLDADNMVLPAMLRSCSRVLSERQNLAYVTTYFECRREDGTKLPWQLSPIAKPLGAVDPLLLIENTAGDALGMIRRSALDDVGGYSTSIYCFEDWDLWLKFHEKRMEGDVIPEIYFVYRLRSDSMSRSLGTFDGIHLQQKLLRNHEGLVKGQSIAISTLLLHEYWSRWRRDGQRNGEAPDLLMDTLRRAMNDPVLTLRYVTSELKSRLRRKLQIRRFSSPSSNEKS